MRWTCVHQLLKWWGTPERRPDSGDQAVASQDAATQFSSQHWILYDSEKCLRQGRIDHLR
jgi:hypothetical protein